jgi:hypothetical protein
MRESAIARVTPSQRKGRDFRRSVRTKYATKIPIMREASRPSRRAISRVLNMNEAYD